MWGDTPDEQVLRMSEASSRQLLHSHRDPAATCCTDDCVVSGDEWCSRARASYSWANHS